MATKAGPRPANSSSAAASADADSGERGGHSSKETKRPAPIRSQTVATRGAYRASEEREQRMASPPKSHFEPRGPGPGAAAVSRRAAAGECWVRLEAMAGSRRGAP